MTDATHPSLRAAAWRADAYRKHTISKWAAVAMLVTTLVAAALAIYFGYKAWHAGVDLGSISKLMSSIPFDVTFLIGCSAAVISIGATVYSIYQYYQDTSCVKNKNEKNIPAERPISNNGNNGINTELTRISHTFSGNSHTLSPDLHRQESDAVLTQHCPRYPDDESQVTERRFASKKCEKYGLEAAKVEKDKQKPLTLQEQAFHAALSLECQRNKLPNIAPMLEQINAVTENFSDEKLIEILDQGTDQVLNKWAIMVSGYLNDRWAWPAASGRYSVIRQLITDPNLNVPLRNPTFILAIFARSHLVNPIMIFDLNIAEMLISTGFRDQHPALLECQPYNNAFFIEDVELVHNQAHEERLLQCYLMRKQCSFIEVMQAIEAAAKKIGISVVDCAASSSHFDDIYGSTLWENGNIMACFRQFKQSINSEEKFEVQGHTFVNSYGQSLQGFLALCRILYPKSAIADAHPNFSFVSSTDLAQRIAHHPTVLLEYDVCHLWYDVMHLQAMFAGQSRKYHFKDGQFAMIDIVEKILSHIQTAGLKPDNAITAQQLYLRLYALADLKSPGRLTNI